MQESTEAGQSGRPCERLLLGVTGSIDCSLLPSFVAALREDFTDELRIIMTSAAQRMLQPKTLSLFGRCPVYTELWTGDGDDPVPHISLARWATLFAVIPASADTLARIAHGSAGDLLSATALGYPGRLLIAPAMNAVMWNQPSVRRNVRMLRDDGHDVIEPEPGLCVADTRPDGGAVVPREVALAHLWQAAMERNRSASRTAPPAEHSPPPAHAVPTVQHLATVPLAATSLDEGHGVDGTSIDEARPWRPQTLAVRGGLVRSDLLDTSEPLHVTSSFVHRTAADAEARFAGVEGGFVYSRYGNPTVHVFEERLRLMETAPACISTASGMSAVYNALTAVLDAGDRVVAPRALFGSTSFILHEVLGRWEITTETVDGTDLDQWRTALSRPTSAVFLESPSNPMLDLIDVRAVAHMAHQAGALVIMDNILATGVLQRPFELGVDVVVYSGAKHMDGQGRVLGGAILGSADFIEGVLRPLLWNTGPTMSPFDAWVLAKGLETMRSRVDQASTSALRVAEFLERHDQVRSVRYPFLPSHPQYDLAKTQMSAGGTVVTLELDADGDRARVAAFAVMNALRLVDIASNFGDTKSLCLHPASTTHRHLDADARAAIGVTDGVIRLSVGLEDPDDLMADLDYALKRAL